MANDSVEAGTADMLALSHGRPAENQNQRAKESELASDKPQQLEQQSRLAAAEPEDCEHRDAVSMSAPPADLSSASDKQVLPSESGIAALPDETSLPASPVSEPAAGPPLLTSATASKSTSPAQTQSGSSTPHSSLLQAHSTTERSLSMATSLLSESDFGIGSSLISAASLSAPSEQASDSTAGASSQQQEDRAASHAAASTSAESYVSGRPKRMALPDQAAGVTADWKRQSKHVLILSNAGKPVWSLHGDENALAGLMAVVQALVSFVHDRGDTMQAMRAGKHRIVFLERGPLILVIASAQGEPDVVLLQQLRLIHGQIISILSASFEKMFARNPSYDLRKLLGATSHVLEALVRSFDVDPSALLKCLVPLPMKSSLRHSTLLALQAAVKSAGALFGVMLTQDAIVTVAQSRAHMLHPHDLLLLANLIRSNDSFRQAQTFTPVCLPRFNPAAFLHAYVQYLDVEAEVCVVLLSAQAESFFALAEAAQDLEKQLKQTGVLQSIASQVQSQTTGGLLDLEALPAQCGGGPASSRPLLHFLYKSPTRAQVIAPKLAATFDTLQLQQAAMQRYATVHTTTAGAVLPGAHRQQSSASTSPASSSASAPLHRPVKQQVHWASDGHMSILALVSPEYELYSLFDALTDKDTAMRLCHKLSVYIKAQQADMFMPF